MGCNSKLIISVVNTVINIYSYTDTPPPPFEAFITNSTEPCGTHICWDIPQRDALESRFPIPH